MPSSPSSRSQAGVHEEGATNPSKFREKGGNLRSSSWHWQPIRNYFGRIKKKRQPSADREMGAYGYSDFTSALHKKMLDKKKLQKELGFTKTEPRRRRN
jgi:hypothetical protein